MTVGLVSVFPAGILAESQVPLAGIVDILTLKFKAPPVLATLSGCGNVGPAIPCWYEKVSWVGETFIGTLTAGGEKKQSPVKFVPSPPLAAGIKTSMKLPVLASKRITPLEKVPTYIFPSVPKAIDVASPICES